MRGVDRYTKGSLLKALFLPSEAMNVNGFEQDACWLLAVARVTTIKMKIVPLIRPIEQRIFSLQEKERKRDLVRPRSICKNTAII